MNIFSYAGIQNFFKEAKKLAPVIPFSEWDGQQRVILMRHDIDLDVQPAHAMFRIQQEVGVKSSFFFLTTCHSYNPCSYSNRSMIREISDGGFEVGLHFDPLLYDESKLQEAISFETSVLEQITGKPVKSISLHNPSMHGRFPTFHRFNNVYEEPFFSSEYYLSDSRMNFREKDPFRFLQKVKERSIQVLFHPLHFTEQGVGYQDIMSSFRQDFLIKVDQQFRPNNKSYADQVATIV